MHQPGNISPPQWPVKLLRFFIRKEYLEEIEGDMEELFLENTERFSLRKARIIYVREMLTLMRPALIRNLEILRYFNHLPMFRNYFKVSFRGLLKSPLNTFINVFGLALAIGICVFAYAFARWTFSTDQFHENKHTVHLVTFSADRDGTMQQYGRTPRPLMELMREDFTHIRKACRIEDRNAVMKFNDNVFHERVRYTDADFLEMFTFPLKWGTPGSLRDLNNIILSEKMSIKYFGDQNPVGQIIVMIYGKNKSKAFTVSGVAREFPKAKTIGFDFLINFENLHTTEPDYNFHDWKGMVNATLIQVDKPSDIESISKGMDKYRKLQNNAAGNDPAIVSFAFQPLATLHKNSENIRDGISRSSRDNYTSILFIGGIAVFMLLLACSNYINIAIVTATKRLKEIGVRKSIGATRSVVIIQFLSENILVTFLALLIGLTLGYTFFIPGFEYLWGFDMDFRVDDPNLWLYLPVILLLTSIASGIYPSLYISRFQVVSILKGSVRFGQKNPLTKILLSFQMILACVFITCSIMFTQNTNYLSKRSWGYDPHQTMYAVVPDYAAYEELGNQMSQNRDVVSLAGSAHHVGKAHRTVNLQFPDREYEADLLAVNPKYFETVGLTLKEGRNFSDGEGGDRDEVIVNETLVKNMNWENPIGQRFRIDSIQYQVIGVVREFHNYSFSNQVRPLLFTVANKEDFRYLTINVNRGAEAGVYQSLQANWSKLFPEIPFEGGYQEDVWGFYYREIEIYDLVWLIFASIAISLATLGLYGLVRLNVAGRTKEFSIKKVLGAGLKNIAAGIASQYMILFSVSLLVGPLLGYLFSSWLITFSYEYHMPITFSGTALALALMIFIFLATISTQIRKVVRSNPVDGLKSE